MKLGWMKKVIAVVLSGAMMFNLSAVSAFAADDEGGKYVQDVFIAYGKTEKDAQKWLTDNGWEPVEGDFNAGKASFFDNNKMQDQNVAAVMGIKRTDDEHDAVTDMAVMNMKGGYSFADYGSLVNQKKSEINEFINNFQVVIDEFRANHNGEGSDFGKQRADLAYDMLNVFYEGDPEDPNAVNDTGMKLGDFFLAKTMQEGDQNGGDLQQLILESSGSAMLIVETLLALGSDPSEDTWLERASSLTGEDMTANLERYVPEAEGQDVSDSVALQYLEQSFGDTAAALAEQWADIHDEMAWYESYSDANGLWQKKGESAEDFLARKTKFFEAQENEDGFGGDQYRYSGAEILYNNLYLIPYEGDWGETMGDFFNPADGAEYGEQEYFLPMAAALSPGQIASMDFLSLNMLLMIGFGDEEGFKNAMPDINEVLGESEEMDIYTGVKREAFRNGVALTNEALMEQNAGRGAAYDKIWDNTGIVAITAYATAALSITAMIAGRVMMAKGLDFGIYNVPGIKARIVEAKAALRAAGGNKEIIATQQLNLKIAQTDLKQAYKYATPTKMGIAGRWILGVGGVLLVGAAIVKGVQLWKYYDRDMTPIPRMIVDESDIVTYLTDDEGKPILDDKGNQKKNIDFNTYEYYSAVKCNRPEIGEIGDWQDGVKEYEDEEHYCFDIADLNADMGQEWLALYTVKSSNKGDPLLADSLTLQYGSSKTPKGCTKGLHLFTYTNTLDLGDTAWAFNNAKKGVYFFWDVDEGAFAAETASAFSGGQLALAGIAGLILGIGGSTLVMRPRRKKEESEEPATTA
ncbi:MAG: hypothetical protein IJJ07_06155 [Lachnospiraceae bacterium]|nr:hypothetical protein [Lachnospiraceae bacterium]